MENYLLLYLSDLNLQIVKLAVTLTMHIDLKLKILKYILKGKKNYNLDQQIYHIIIGEQVNVFLTIHLILKLMLILVNKVYYSEIKEIEKYFNYLNLGYKCRS